MLVEGLHFDRSLTLARDLGHKAIVFFFSKQKTAYEMSIGDWSSDVCSSDLLRIRVHARPWIWRRMKRSSRPTASRSEERRVGKECQSTCRFRGTAYH